jgi:two-component system sensor histidine kinase HydH
MMKTKTDNGFPGILPVLVAGILIILVPVFTAMTWGRLQRQKQFFTQRLLEKGIFLIRTFEAGARTGMMSMHWGAGRIQDMLHETALQPEVRYMMITGQNGLILAHSDASMVGKFFRPMPQAGDFSADTGDVHHRIRLVNGKVRIFEVYKRFTPMRPGFRRRRLSGRAGRGRHCMENMSATPGTADWCAAYMQDMGKHTSSVHYIFAGLSMKQQSLAEKRIVHSIVWRSALFFMAVCIGMVALFVFQAYRYTKVSLKNIRAFSDNVVQNMPAGLVILNTAHEMTSVNRAAEKILAGKIDRALPEMIDIVREMHKPGQTLHRELSLDIGENKKINLDITASPLLDAQNEITGFLFLFRDLTQIMKLKTQVETNRRLAAIGKLAAGVAHEIRNPLSSIKGFATYLGKRCAHSSADRQAAQIMVKEVERINRSVTQLLEFAKPMDIEKARIDLGEIISHSLRLVHHDLESKSIETRVDIKKQIIFYSDGDRLNQVLLNLYINAAAAMDRGGILEITAREKMAKNMVEIRVKDNGCGMDNDELELIFDPYFTTRPDGTGLGLAIVHRIIQSLGGTISVKSAKGQGSCFFIHLPLGKKDGI